MGSFNLSGIRLSHSDCHAISRVLQDYQPVNIVNFTYCNLDDISMSELLPGVQACHHIKNLCLGNNKLTSIHMLDIVDVIHRNATSLVQVSVRYNYHVTPEVLMATGSAVGDCSKLKWLGMNGCDLPDVNFAVCHRILTRCLKLRRFGFVQGTLGKAEIEELSPRLSALNLTELYFDLNSLTSECCQCLGQIIHDLHNQLLGPPKARPCTQAIRLELGLRGLVFFAEYHAYFDVPLHFSRASNRIAISMCTHAHGRPCAHIYMWCSATCDSGK